MNKNTNNFAHNFYMNVYAYICSEYKPKYSKMVADSSLSPQLYDLCLKYYWGGNTVPFVAAQIVDLLKSKLK